MRGLGDTSGIVVDNAAAGASNIYFSTLLNQSCTGGTGGCAVSATQAALHTLIASPGYFAQSHAWAAVVMFAVLFVLALVGLGLYVQAG